MATPVDRETASSTSIIKEYFLSEGGVVIAQLCEAPL